VVWWILDAEARMTIQIQVVKEATPELVDAAAVLIPQLSSSARAPTLEEWREIVACPVTTFFVARADDKIVGIVTLLLVRISTGLRAILEDLVVLSTHRNRGVGEMLLRAALAHSRSAGARTLDFTSRPSRIDANRLYLQVGFELRDTGVYRYVLDRE
jgi:ribosomal protein S18 acetylase RimI-like enzyme